MVFTQKVSRKSSRSIFSKNKKAFGDAVSSLIMFIAIISVSTGVVILFKNFVVETQGSFNVQSDAVNNKLVSIISISNVYYDSADNKTYVYVKNVGEKSLIPSRFDFYLDNEFIQNFSAKSASNLTKDLQLLVPQDTTALIFDRFLSAGSHEVRVVTEYGSSDEDLFNT